MERYEIRLVETETQEETFSDVNEGYQRNLCLPVVNSQQSNAPVLGYGSQCFVLGVLRARMKIIGNVIGVVQL